ncbi:MAG: prepilin-type N-terminal cleavage/methylation domain-containing protein [Endomicrobium sp.]|jgi:prepilin-type N-terminal cleavage/methylation domain-containing protein|nr:prepilin-type N-terminal cleavage/methylation domain-containing protein [Endomicrobium sp.]
MKRHYGFTLVEMIIVIVIIGILSMIAVPIYRGHVSHSIALEGRALVSEVSAAQEIYKARSKAWYNAGAISGTVTGWTSHLDNATVVADLGLDSRRNQYFRDFSWQIENGSATWFTIATTGDPTTRAQGIEISLTYSVSEPAVINERIINN